MRRSYRSPRSQDLLAQAEREKLLDPPSDRTLSRKGRLAVNAIAQAQYSPTHRLDVLFTLSKSDYYVRELPTPSYRPMVYGV
jgi:hypothetical protein